MSLPKYLMDYRIEHNIPDDFVVPAVLVFDATPVHSTGVGRGLGSCFTFILLSLDHRLPNLVIKSMWYMSGEINQDI
jgi:hypothetical protein